MNARGPIAEFDAWYDNGFGVGDWKAARGGEFVKDCVLRLSDDRLTLQKKIDAQSAPAAASPDQDDAVSKLERLAALHASGALTDDEFAGHKARLLEG
jgi:hypothetical protein